VITELRKCVDKQCQKLLFAHFSISTLSQNLVDFKVVLVRGAVPSARVKYRSMFRPVDNAGSMRSILKADPAFSMPWAHAEATGTEHRAQPSVTFPSELGEAPPDRQ
jgi:hypothetical protein